MKISTSLRTLYDRQLDVNRLVEARVKQLMEATKEPTWFFFGRIKSQESFAQKLETGRFAQPGALDDFFACTLVVENRAAIPRAVRLVERFCRVERQRPPVPGETHKAPDCFPFDDLRLYVRLLASDVAPPGPINDVVFEIQVKTFLQHAWALATHDLVYKAKMPDWGSARIAYQIKAMLEHAEVSIDKAPELATSPELALIDRATREVRETVAWLEGAWPEELLPVDRIRLAKTLNALTGAIGISRQDLADAVTAETERGLGANSVNLSPYAASVCALAFHQTERLEGFLRRDRVRDRVRVLVTPEMELDHLLAKALTDRYVYADARNAAHAADEA